MNDMVRAFEATYDGSWLPSDMLEQYSPLECLADNNNCVTLMLQSRKGKERFVAKCYSRDDVEISVSEDDILSSLSHRSLPEYVGRFENDRTICVVRRYAQGDSLRAVLSKRKFTKEETMEFALEICDVLRFLHSLPMPVLHRDIKPENIIKNDENVYLIDFGISRIVSDADKKDTRIAATASYAPPEQFGFLPTDGRSDIYALGVVINEMITGSTDVRKDVPGDGVGRIIRKCTAFSPEDRYRSVSHLERDIRRWKHRRLRTACHVLLVLVLSALAVTSAIWLAGYFADKESSSVRPENEQLLLDESMIDSMLEDVSQIKPCELRISGDGYYLDDVWFAEGNIEPERITSLVVDDGVQDIREIEFEQFTNLKSIVMPESVSEQLCNDIVNKARDLECITVGAAPETGVSWKYDFTSNTLEVFCDGVGTGVLEYDLYWNRVKRIDTSRIRHIVVGEGIKEIRFNVFWDYTFLESLSLPASLEILDSSTFADNRSLKTVTVSPDNPWFCVIDGALYERGGAGEESVYKLYFVPRNRTGSFVVHPGTVLIGKFSFEDCKMLEEVVLPSSLSGIDGSAFVNTQSIKRIVVPENSIFSFDEENGILMAVKNKMDSQGVPYTEAQIIYAVCSFSGHYTTPEEYDCVLLGDGAFEGCDGITEVTITDNVLRIGAEVFMGCSALRKVNMPDDITSLTKRFESVGITYFDHASFSGSAVTSLRVPYGVTNISEWCFFECWNLREIYIPDTVTEIEDHALEGCAGLEIIYYPD